MYSEHSSAIAAPPQRRRRLVFSCNQCRKRKIKCDQKIPCTQCQRSKDVFCTYAFDTNAPQSLKTQRGAKTSSLIIKQRERSRLGNELPVLTPESSISGASAAHSPVVSGLSSTTEPGVSESRPDHLDPRTTHVLPSFHDRVVKRQVELPSTLYSPDIERHVAGNEAMPDLERQLRPSPIKMKLYGESHWGNELVQMSLKLLCNEYELLL